MFKSSFFKPRFSVLFYFIAWFLIVSQLLRFTLFFWQYDQVSWNILAVLRTIATGLIFDLGTITFISLVGIFYYALLPNRWIGSWADKLFIWFFTTLIVFILVFTFFAELTFWEEFRTRFNFIAVDYLIYTNEVISNIEESYPLPLLIGIVVLITALIIYFFYKRNAFLNTFTHKVHFKNRAILLGAAVIIALFYVAVISNNQAEWSANRYNSEISKSGIYSFFAAFRNNQMKYDEFYTSIEKEKAFGIIREKLNSPNTKFTAEGNSIHRNISDTVASAENKNVVFILVESLSASFLKEFGNNDNITPFLDSISQKSISFTNLYATGTRTVRGMEAVTLCIPPTPGQSIVKRPENQDLYTISNVFKARQYDCNFFYGGDGYFDNMNSYFGGNGFNIYDRGRGSVLSDAINTKRNNIADSEVTFENAWGICDEDIFNKMISVADRQFEKNLPFFNFVMTTSNHRPFTYPSGKIAMPSGTSREGAVKYTDYAIKKLFEKARTKPWFKNTVFIIIADHCASSAGKDEIDVANYHIPAIIVNMPPELNQKVDKQCSQIDLWPTIFSLFHWNYESDFFGKDVLASDFEARALIGTYRKLALLKGEKVMVLSDQKKQAFYTWNKKDNNLTALKMQPDFLEETVSWFQTADYLFSNKLLK